ncbi:MAG: T9SS type A sorting domain-containing protein [Owenweeksia sp.]|nr:T9SS type A sorting domain-containing protein [Owenweeksia sp.]
MAGLPEAVTITVLHADGRELMHMSNVSDNHVLDLSVLPPGVYLLKIFNDKGELKGTHKQVLR